MNIKGGEIIVNISTDEVTITLANLLNRVGILVSTVVDSGREQGVRVARCRMLGSFEGKTAGDGPIYVGLCVGFTTATLKDFFDSDPQGQITDQEQPENGAFIKVVGVLPASEVSGRIQGMTDDWAIALKNWSIPEGSTLQAFAFNASGSQLTTGTLVDLQMLFDYIWLKD